jgi:hypothetical protein
VPAMVIAVSIVLVGLAAADVLHWLNRPSVPR